MVCRPHTWPSGIICYPPLIYYLTERFLFASLTIWLYDLFLPIFATLSPNLFSLCLGPGPYIRIVGISSEIKSHNYTGFGRVNVSCTGQGDNATKVHWTRTDKDGNSISLNITILRMKESSGVVGSPGKWRADLLDRPDTTKFPYSYKCIVENNCCLTKMSSLLNMRYSPPPGKYRLNTENGDLNKL